MEKELSSVAVMVQMEEKERATSFGRKEAEFEVEATHEVRSRVWCYGIHCIYYGFRCIRLRSSLFLGLF